MALAGVGLLAGCTATPDATQSLPVSLPDGVSVSIFQNRDDYGPRRLEISVENASPAALTVTKATLASKQFAGGTSWTRPTEVPSGSTRNLRVDLPATDCDTDATAATVTLAFELPDGSVGTATVTPADPFDQLAKITSEDCAAIDTERTVTITLGDKLRTEQRGDETVALLDVTFTPTGTGEPVAVDEILRTTLVQPADGTAAWAVGESFDAASEARSITLDIVPANCRLHTVAEDKRGTFFPFAVRDEVFYVPASSAVKEQIYDYIAAYCGWDSDTPLE